MASLEQQAVGVFLVTKGWVCAILSCLLPNWLVIEFSGSDIIRATTIWKGLWKSCVAQEGHQTQCKAYDSLLGRLESWHKSRVLMVTCIITAGLGLLLCVVGSKCLKCVEKENTKAKIRMGAGALCLLAGLLVMVSVSWVTHNIMQGFSSRRIPSVQKGKMGAALYIGWASSGLLLLGGPLLSCNCSPLTDRRHSVRYQAASSSIVCNSGLNPPNAVTR